MILVIKCLRCGKKRITHSKRCSSGSDQKKKRSEHTTPFLKASHWRSWYINRNTHWVTLCMKCAIKIKSGMVVRPWLAGNQCRVKLTTFTKQSTSDCEATKTKRLLWILECNKKHTSAHLTGCTIHKLGITWWCCYSTRIKMRKSMKN